MRLRDVFIVATPLGEREACELFTTNKNNYGSFQRGWTTNFFLISLLINFPISKEQSFDLFMLLARAERQIEKKKLIAVLKLSGEKWKVKRAENGWLIASRL